MSVKNTTRPRVAAFLVVSVLSSQAMAANPTSGTKSTKKSDAKAAPSAAPQSTPPPSSTAAEADRLFTEAKRLMGEGHVSEACHSFEESQKLDPAVGTQFNIADCYERGGRLATAYRQFTDLKDVLARVGDARAAQAESRARALEPKLPRIVIRVPWAKDVSGLVVSRDGQIVEPRDFGTPVAVDPGAHAIRVQATNKKNFETSVTATEGKTETLDVPTLADVGKQVVVRNTGLSQRSLGLIVGGVGIAAVGTSVVLGLVAKGNYDDAVSGCTDLGDRFQCPAGNRSGDAASAQSMGTVATIVGGIGAAAIVTGGVLWLTGSRTPKTAEKQASSVQVVPFLDPSRAGVMLSGSM